MSKDERNITLFVGDVVFLVLGCFGVAGLASHGGEKKISVENNGKKGR